MPLVRAAGTVKLVWDCRPDEVVHPDGPVDVRHGGPPRPIRSTGARVRGLTSRLSAVRQEATAVRQRVCHRCQRRVRSPTVNRARCWTFGGWLLARHEPQPDGSCSPSAAHRRAQSTPPSLPPAQRMGVVPRSSCRSIAVTRATASMWVRARGMLRRAGGAAAAYPQSWACRASGFLACCEQRRASCEAPNARGSGSPVPAGVRVVRPSPSPPPITIGLAILRS
jgi:hypothetical protein